jgi:hypothetical protein
MLVSFSFQVLCKFLNRHTCYDRVYHHIVHTEDSSIINHFGTQFPPTRVNGTVTLTSFTLWRLIFLIFPPQYYARRRLSSREQITAHQDYNFMLSKCYREKAKQRIKKMVNCEGLLYSLMQKEETEKAIRQERLKTEFSTDAIQKGE